MKSLLLHCAYAPYRISLLNSKAIELSIEFLAAIEHELRQPLGAIVNYSLALIRIIEKSENPSQENTLLKEAKKM